MLALTREFGLIAKLQAMLLTSMPTESNPTVESKTEHLSRNNEKSTPLSAFFAPAKIFLSSIFLQKFTYTEKSILTGGLLCVLYVELLIMMSEFQEK